MELVCTLYMGSALRRSDVVQIVKNKFELTHNRLKLQDLYDIGISKEDLYANFNSIEELEMEIRDIEDSDDLIYECDKCNAVFDSRASLIGHESAANHDRLKHEKRARELLGDAINTPIAYKFRLIRTTDGKEFVYVGATESPLNRLTEHMRGANIISIPIEGKMMGSKEYEFVEFLDKVECDSKAEAREVERRMYLEHAIENQAMNLLGGK